MANERIQDLCYDFLPETNYADNSGLPQDSKDIYNAFEGDERNFFEGGRQKFFAAQANPHDFFDQGLEGADGEVQSARSVQNQCKTPPKPMTPIEIMFATQMAMRETFDKARTNRNKVEMTGGKVDRLAAMAGVSSDPNLIAKIAARKAKETNSAPPVALKDFSKAPERDVKIKVLRD